MKILESIQENNLKFGDRVVVVSQCQSTGQSGRVIGLLKQCYVLVELDCGDTKSYYHSSLARTNAKPNELEPSSCDSTLVTTSSCGTQYFSQFTTNKNNKSMEDNKMKIELRCDKVAVVQAGSGKYFYALYDEDIVAGDKVAVTGMLAGGLHRVADVLTIEEARTVYSGPITEEVINRLDESAYQCRLENRAKKEVLRKKMDKAIQSMTENQFYEKYAQVNPEIAAILEEYNRLK